MFFGSLAKMLARYKMLMPYATWISLGTTVLTFIMGLLKGKRDNKQKKELDPPPVPSTTPLASQTPATTPPAATQQTTAATTPPATTTQPTTTTAPPADTGPQPWYKKLATNNVFMILTATALMGLGLNLGMDGPSHHFIAVPGAKLPAWHDALDSSIGGGKLPSVATSVLGKVFIQSAENNGISPDKVVYVSNDTRCSGADCTTRDNAYAVNMLSLDYDGYATSPKIPALSQVPIFYKDDRGAIRFTPKANSELAAVRALALAAASGTTSAQSAQSSAVMGSEGGHE